MVLSKRVIYSNCRLERIQEVCVQIMFPRSVVLQA